MSADNAIGAPVSGDGPAAAVRTVRVGSIAYRDPRGGMRRADTGAVVEVHPDDVARFDRLNVLLPVLVESEPVAVEPAGAEPEPESDSTDADSEPEQKKTGNRRAPAKKPDTEPEE